MGQALRLRPPRLDELPALSALCLRSKGHWDYDLAFLEACRPELTLTPDDLDPARITVAETAEGLLGLAQISVKGDEAELEKLFVEPAAIGTGVGRRLFDWAAAAARALGARRMTIDADPDAAPIYRRLGAVDCGTSPSASIPGRMLPRLAVDLEAGR